MQDKNTEDRKSETERLLDELLREKNPYAEPETETEETAAASDSEATQAFRSVSEPQDKESASEDTYREETRVMSRSRLIPPSDSDLHAGDAVLEREQAHRETLANAPHTPHIPVAGTTAVKNVRKRRKTNLPFVLIWLTLVLAISIILGTTVIFLGKDLYAIGKSGPSKTVTIEAGATTEEIAQLLFDEGIVRVPKFYQLISKLNGAGAEYIAGEHVVDAGMGYEEIIESLTTAMDEETVVLTFKEGITLYDAAQMLEEAEVCEASRFLYFFNVGGYDFNFEQELPASSSLKFYEREGYFFPDTYEFYIDMDPELACQRIYKNFDTKMTEGYIDELGMTYYERIDQLGVSLDYVITLASMVQAEASNVGSMCGVSSVFWNRLNHSDIFPLLQSDPTTKYVDEVIKPNIQVANDVIFEAYDTYRGQGLPPGAICNPGIDAIEAALNPTESNNYYFCANVDTQVVYYAETNEEHEANLARIQEEKAAAAEMGDGEAGQEDTEE